MAEIDEETKAALESIPDIDWESAKEVPKEAQPPKPARKPRAVAVPKKPEKPKVKIALNSPAMQFALSQAGTMPLFVAQKVAVIVSKGKYNLPLDPNGVAECKERFSAALGTLELEASPWGAYAFACASTIVGGLLFSVIQKANEIETAKLAAMKAATNAPDANTSPQDEQQASGFATAA